MKTLFGILIFFAILCGIFFILQNHYKVIQWTINDSYQLAEASNLYNEPYILPEILITSPISGSKYSIKDEINIDFSVTDANLSLNASLDKQPVNNGDIIKGEDLAIGNHTLAVRFSSTEVDALSGTVEGEKVTFAVVPLVGVKGLISEDGEFVNFIIEGLGVENIYDKNIGLIYHDKVNDTEIGLNSEDISSSIGDYDSDTIPELKVSFKKAWRKDILDTNPYAEFTLRLELNDGTILNVSSADWESHDPSQLLVVGLKDGVATISGIDITGDPTGEVSIKLKDEIGEIINTEPLGVATNSNGNIWVSFSDRRIRMYNSCGEIQKIDGVNWYWTVSSRPDGLDYDGISLRYCSSETNKLYQISPSGVESDLGIVKRRLSVDGVATDNTSVQYTTQEYTGYNPTGVSGTYLCSANLGKISKRAINIGQNFIQTLPVNTPIWTNEQNTSGSCLGITQIADTAVPEGYVIYLSCSDGNVYKIRFEDTSVKSVSSSHFATFQWSSVDGFLGAVGGPRAGREQRSQSPTDDITNTQRTYYRVDLSEVTSFIKAFAVHKTQIRSQTNNVKGTWPVSDSSYNVCSFFPSWTNEQKFNNPTIGNLLWTSIVSGSFIDQTTNGEQINSAVRITDVANKISIPISMLYYIVRYGNEGQTFPVYPGGPIGYAGAFNPSYLAPAHTWVFLINNGSLTILDQFTTSNPVPQGLAVGKLHSVELGFQNIKMVSPKVVDPIDPPKDVRIGVIQGDNITFKATLTPNITLEDNQYTWSGEKSGTGPTISITFNTTGNKSESLTVLGCTRVATTTVLYVPPPNEDTWIGQTAFNPVRAIIVNSLANQAEQWVSQNATALGGGIHNGRADAARHAYWNVLISIHPLLGPGIAEEVTTAHERTNLEESAPHNETVMDIENNAYGRIIAIVLPAHPNRVVCQNAVISALNADALTILDDLENINEVGLLQPSNQ